MTTPKPYLAGEPGWRYPEAGDEPAPRGVQMLLLTEGGICVRGQWGPGFLAWSPLLKRDKVKEKMIREKRCSSS